MYSPRRTARYEYVAELLEEIESEQCVSCVFNSQIPEFPMCVDLAGQAMLEFDIPEWDEDEFGKAVCTKYEYATPSHVRQEVVRDQDTLDLA